ncbi:zinc transporter ZIP1-like [Arctopsyche grandis]|uniref:zinc transporter ZIP1-like n=1 Tax=Arctopsyche grandis TaxID=121162 RepID=UPI00406D8A30
MATVIDEIMLRHGDDDGDKAEVVLAKAVAMVVLFLASLVFGLLPMLLAKKFNMISDDESASEIKNSNKVVVALLSFGGGVLLCTTFQHLLPEVGANIMELQEDGDLPELAFHLESLLMCLGFFTMYFAEELVQLYLRKRSGRSAKKHSDAMLVRTLSIRHSIINNNRLPTISTSDLIAKDPEKSLDTVSTIMSQNGSEHQHKGHGHSHNHCHVPVADTDEDPVIASLRGLLIVLALSIHELFEGLAVGLESSASNVWYMFAAVSAHKLVIAFCVGVELVSARTRPFLSFIYTLTFAAVSPIGIGIGLALVGGSGASASGLTSVILQGLASGTLLYVVFFEILQRDRAGFLQLGMAIVGFALMFGLQFVAPHDHSHGHGHEHDHDDHDHL